MVKVAKKQITSQNEDSIIDLLRLAKQDTNTTQDTLIMDQFKLIHTRLETIYGN